jgi:hypothetical protein
MTVRRLTAQCLPPLRNKRNSTGDCHAAEFQTGRRRWLNPGFHPPQKLVWRARIVLMWADGAGLAKILQTTGKTKRTAYRWRDRYLARVRRAAILWATDLQTGTGVKGAAR